MWMQLSEEPVAYVRVDRHIQIAQHRHRGGGGVGGTDGHPVAPEDFVGPRSVIGFEEFQGTHQFHRIGQRRAKILIRSESEKSAVSRSARAADCRAKTAIT